MISLLREHPAAARTFSAVAVLLLFWGALAWDFRGEIGALLLRVAYTPHAEPARTVPSAYLSVEDRSQADPALLEETVARLEADCQAVQSFLGRDSQVRVPVSIVEGSGPAMTDGRRLIVYHRQGQIELSTAPFFLVLLGEGDLAAYDLRLIVEGGFAVYVAEEIGRAGPLLGQTSDAWVRWWRQQGTYVPLSKAWQAELPGAESQVPGVLRAIVEGASFLQWVASRYGLDGVEELRAGFSVFEVTGLSTAEAERAWLQDLEARPIEAASCAAAVPSSSPLSAYCPDLDRAAPC